ncbi:MAG: TonB-dependent receptor [Melioribacteraceae bacterium]|nr:TonB-dependent receptor [Melioribacteraceae bacterium]MCF8264871.1 TonB-dependent receptor [Melioribacteraceae bacterium]
MRRWNIFSTLAILFIAGTIFAQQYTLSGKVTSSTNGEALIGANVYIKGSYVGAPTDANGNYSIKLDGGTYKIVCSYIGFQTQETEVSVFQNTELNFDLDETQFSLSVEVLADRAKERETPVAFTNVDKEQMELVLGSQDIPLALNITPSVYATPSGGGAGDARVNVRGFNQRNVAIMINGVPINDMENGWVYWSNWDGVGDATSSIQVQRGLSAINLATPSIGGTMNIVTDPAALNPGIKVKQEFGSGNFLKSSASVNTGLVDNTWALSATIVRKLGDGVIDKTWTDAWAYYLGYSYNINKKNRIEFYALGAPQTHGQNLYKQNAAVYSHEFAKELGYDQAVLDAIPEQGTNFNQTWGPVDPSYKSDVAWNSNLWTSTSATRTDRYASDFINERENFFHKPIMNLNWYSTLTNNLSLYSTLYYSGGMGGGTGTHGSLAWDYSGFSRTPDWNGTIARNIANNGASRGVLRNSRNNQWTVGLISKAYYKVSDNLKTSFGIDWRTAEIEHYYEVRDLLGGQYYYVDHSDFWNEGQKYRKLGDKFNYFNTNTVDWFGGYAQAEYTQSALTAYATVGLSTIKYSFTDHFADDGSGNELFTESDWINGFQVKGGASYRLSDAFTLFANAGYVEQVPIFDNVINDGDGTKADNPENEKFTHIEAGVGYRGWEGKLHLKANYYYTIWTDRANSRNVTNSDGTEGLIFLSGMDQTHTGVEVELALQPIKMVRLDASASFGNWQYTDDVAGRYTDYSGGGINYTDFNYYIKDLKVGDQPQTSFAIIASVFPIKGLTFSGIFRYYADHYADFDPLSRTDATDRTQSWLTPSYSIVDLHMTYDLPLQLQGANFQLFGHVFNLLDELYVQDAVDNSSFNAYSANGRTHSADDAEIYLGLPMTFNVGLSVTF